MAERQEINIFAPAPAPEAQDPPVRRPGRPRGSRNRSRSNTPTEDPPPMTRSSTAAAEAAVTEETERPVACSNDPAGIQFADEIRESRRHLMDSYETQQLQIATKKHEITRLEKAINQYSVTDAANSYQILCGNEFDAERAFKSVKKALEEVQKKYDEAEATLKGIRQQKAELVKRRESFSKNKRQLEMNKKDILLLQEKKRKITEAIDETIDLAFQPFIDKAPKEKSYFCPLYCQEEVTEGSTTVLHHFHYSTKIDEKKYKKAANCMATNIVCTSCRDKFCEYAHKEENMNNIDLCPFCQLPVILDVEENMK